MQLFGLVSTGMRSSTKMLALLSKSNSQTAAPQNDLECTQCTQAFLEFATLQHNSLHTNIRS